MTEEHALLLWRIARQGLSPALFGGALASNGWTNEKLTRIVRQVEDRPPTAKQSAAFLRRWRAKQEAQL